MFNLGMPEIILILVVALIVMGPKKLPEMAKSLGKGLREFRKATDDLKDSIEKDLRDDVKKIKEEPSPSAAAPEASPEAAEKPGETKTGDAGSS
ncbi:MAG: Sec-independent protein translocase protein TatB [Myxococcota bacterium]